MPTRLLRLRLAVLIAWVGCSIFAIPAVAAEPPAWHRRAAEFLQSLRRDDGGYAFPDQQQSHLTPTYAAVGTLKLLGVEPRDKPKLAAFIRDGHPQRWKKPERPLHQFDYEQIQALLWLGEDVSSFKQTVREWTAPKPYMARYEVHSYPAFQQEIACLLSRKLLGLPTDLPAYETYIVERRRDNGSYNNTKPADDHSDGHVVNTLWAIRGLQAMGKPIERKAELIAWLQSCQRPEGHFTYAPDPVIGGKSNDIIYTWAAVEALKLLDARPSRPDECARYVRSLWRSWDGGFADRPFWPSNSVAAFYAVQVLADLDQLGHHRDLEPELIGLGLGPPDLSGFQVFTAQIEAPGAGSPADAVELARVLKIHLWGAKNAKPVWIERAQQIADERKVPVRFFVADEEYGTFFSVPGMGTYSHLADVIAPAGADIGKSLAGVEPTPTYAQFVEKRIAPLVAAGGRNVYQFNENECLARMLLDESVDGGGAFSAISTFHFGNPDFVNSSPYLWHYQQRLPMIALQDAHAAEPWLWADQLSGFRTLFLAKEPTWEGFMDAMKHNRVLSVRHDENSRGQTWMHGATGAVRAEILKQSDRWQWWSDDGKPPAIDQPAVSVAVLRPDDDFEAGKPDKGLAIRVRPRWENTAQGMPKLPVTELVSLTVDGKQVEPALVKAKPGKGAKFAPAGIADSYYLYDASGLSPGKHTVTAVVRQVQNPGKQSKQVAEFVVP